MKIPADKCPHRHKIFSPAVLVTFSEMFSTDLHPADSVTLNVGRWGEKSGKLI